MFLTSNVAEFLPQAADVDSRLVSCPFACLEVLMREEPTLINISDNHMMLHLDNLPFMVWSYLKLKPSVLKATEEINGQDKIRGLLVTVSSSMTVLTFPVMLTSQCCSRIVDTQICISLQAAVSDCAFCYFRIVI